MNGKELLKNKMGTLSEIFVILRGILLFWIIVCIICLGIYCTTRLISYAVYKSKLQAYFNLKTEEETNGKKEQEEKEKIVVQK